MSERIAVIGLGAMGFGIASNLLKGGHQVLVTYTGAQTMLSDWSSQEHSCINRRQKRSMSAMSSFFVCRIPMM